MHAVVTSWIVIEALTLFILFAVIFLGYKVFRFFQLIATIFFARNEFHKYLIEINAIYSQNFPTSMKHRKRSSSSSTAFLDSTQSSSCRTAISRNSIDLPVEIHHSPSGPSTSLMLAKSQNVWLRYSQSKEEAVEKAMESSSAISQCLKIEKTTETHLDIPILKVMGVGKKEGSMEKSESSKFCAAAEKPNNGSTNSLKLF